MLKISTVCACTHILSVAITSPTATDSLLVHFNEGHFLLGQVLGGEVLGAGSEALEALLLALHLGGGVNLENGFAAIVRQERSYLLGEPRADISGGGNVLTAWEKDLAEDRSKESGDMKNSIADTYYIVQWRQRNRQTATNLRPARQ